MSPARSREIVSQDLAGPPDAGNMLCVTIRTVGSLALNLEKWPATGPVLVIRRGTEPIAAFNTVDCSSRGERLVLTREDWKRASGAFRREAHASSERHLS